MKETLLCGHCGEPIRQGERAPCTGTPLHHECQIRLIVGSVAHIEHRCGCYVEGSKENDPPHMTLREAAQAAVQLHDQRVNEQVIWRPTRSDAN
jgi:hypothetical protein